MVVGVESCTAGVATVGPRLYFCGPSTNPIKTKMQKILRNKNLYSTEINIFFVNSKVCFLLFL
jgi:hypothetical protein